MRKIINRNNFLNAYYIFFVFRLLYKFVGVVVDHKLKMGWDITEWLINYQGGFVRRGLRGEIIYQLYSWFNLDPYLVITIITTISLVSLIFIITRGFIKKGYSIFILPFVFFLGNTIINDDWMRVDSLLLLIFIFIIYLSVYRPKLYLVWINLLLVLALLIHEIFAFFCFPVLILLLSYNKKNKMHSYIYSSLNLFVAFVVFILVLYFKGTQEMASVIWESWKDVPFSFVYSTMMTESAPGAISGLGLTVREGLSNYTGRFLRSFDSGLYGVLMLLVTIVVIYIILTNVNKLNNPILKCKPKDLGNKPLISTVLVFQFCAVFPLYIIGFDYSRWIYLWVISSFALLLYVPEEELNKILPRAFGLVSGKVNSLLYNIVGDSKVVVIMLSLIVGIPLYSWTLSLYVNSNSLYVVFSGVSRIIRMILNICGVDVIA